MSRPVFDRNRYDITIGTQESKTGGFIDPAIRRDALHNVKAFAAREFGGYTIVESSGGWINPDGDLVTESSIVLTVCVPRETGDDAIAEFAKVCGRFLDQHSVVLTQGDFVAILECD